MALTQEQVNQFRQKYGIGSTGATTSKPGTVGSLFGGSLSQTEEKAGILSRVGSDTGEAVSSPQPSRISETFGDVKETVTGIRDEFGRARQEIGKSAQATRSGEQGFGSGLLQSIGSGISAVSGSAGRLFTGIGKTSLSQEKEDAVAEGTQKFLGVDIANQAEQTVNTLTEQQNSLLDTRAQLKQSGGDVTQIDNLLRINAEALQQTAQSLTEVGEAIPVSESFNKVTQKIEQVKEDDPELYNNLRAVTRIGEAVFDVAGGSVVTRTLREGVDFATDVFKTTKQLDTVDDIIAHADDVVTTNPSRYGVVADAPEALTRRADETAEAFARRQAEATAPDVSIKERWAGLAPDTKRAIQGEGETLKGYIDSTIAKNNDTALGGAYGFAEDRVNETAQTLRKQLNDTGSDIGKTRQKLATVKADITQVDTIENAFKNDLKKLNLELRNGQIVQKTGAPTKIGGSGDLRALNDMWREINILKQDPRLQTMIDVRAGLDTRIKFEKLSQGISDAPEGVALSTRKAIADVAAQVVGKPEAARLAEYSDYIQALSDMEEFTRRRDGASYLLRVSQSARGTEANQILDTVAKYTGTDLRKDAVMLNLVTEIFGNQAQKSLLRQQLENAGVALGALRGDPNALVKLADQAAGKLVDKEKILIEATQSQ